MAYLPLLEIVNALGVDVASDDDLGVDLLRSGHGGERQPSVQSSTVDSDTRSSATSKSEHEVK